MMDQEKKDVNQRIREEFVKREILCDMTSIAKFILHSKDDDAPFGMDDMLGGGHTVCPYCGGEYFEVQSREDIPAIQKNEDGEYLCPVCGSAWNYEDDAKRCCLSMEDGDILRCEQCGHLIKDSEVDYELDTDDLEWWAVTPWMADQLLEYGEAVIDANPVFLWGREADDTPLYNDFVIADICVDAKIMDGQENSWSKYV